MTRIQLPTAVGRTIVAAAISFAVNIGTAQAATFTQDFDGALAPDWSTSGTVEGTTDKYVSLSGSETLSFNFILAADSLVDFSFWYGGYVPLSTVGTPFEWSLSSFSATVGRTNNAPDQLAQFINLNPGPSSGNPLNTQYPTSGSLLLGAGGHTLTFQSHLGLDAGTKIDDFTMNVTAVPEPGSWAMLLAGLGAMGVVSRRRRPVQD
jgi:hypothetical protein